MPKKEYDCLIFDADHTLLDFAADESAAFRVFYEDIGIEPTDEVIAFSRHHSEDTWTRAGLRNVHETEMQRRYHELYRSHLTELFQIIFDKYPPKGVLTPKQAGERFLVHLEQVGAPLPHAEAVLSKLSQKTGGKYRICIATNGLVSIQTGRLQMLKNYAHEVYISEEMGVIKPDPAFFAQIFEQMGVTAENCLMIGDSLASDVLGANRVQMDSCWVNVERRKNPTPICPTYEIHSLLELLELL